MFTYAIFEYIQTIQYFLTTLDIDFFFIYDMIEFLGGNIKSIIVKLIIFKFIKPNTILFPFYKRKNFLYQFELVYVINFMTVDSQKLNIFKISNKIKMKISMKILHFFFELYNTFNLLLLDDIFI